MQSSIDEFDMTGNEMKHCFECCYISSTKQDNIAIRFMLINTFPNTVMILFLSVLKPLLE